MYNVYNKSECIFLWDINKQTMSLIGSEKDFIKFLAKSYKRSFWTNEYSNPYFDNFICNQNEYNETKQYQFFDGYDRCINPKVYEKEAWLLYLNKYKNLDKHRYCYWRKNKIYKGTFRQTPVEGTGKRWRGGPYQRPRRTRKLNAMYLNPEYKGFNRGTHKNIPQWWDDFPNRCNERNWKSQRKHQWKEKKE